MTNFERIKAMSIDELAECSVFMTVDYEKRRYRYANIYTGGFYDEENQAIAAAKEYLESEVQENDN